jgi:hypothetical protein
MSDEIRRAERVVAMAISVIVVIQGTRWAVSGDQPPTGLLIALAAMTVGALVAFGALRLSGRRRGSD